MINRIETKCLYADKDNENGTFGETNENGLNSSPGNVVGMKKLCSYSLQMIIMYYNSVWGLCQAFLSITIFIYLCLGIFKFF